MSLIDVIDKQSNKLVSKSGNMEQYIWRNGTFSPNNITAQNSEWLSLINGISNSISGNRTISNSPVTSTNTTTNTTTNSIAKMADFEKSMLANQSEYLSLMKSNSDFSKDIGITNAVFSGIGGLTNLGLGIWQAVESNKTLKKQRQLIDEQIAASQEARQQRRDEIARLNKVRGNTSKRFSSGAVISRSY